MGCKRGISNQRFQENVHQEAGIGAGSRRVGGGVDSRGGRGGIWGEETQ